MNHADAWILASAVRDALPMSMRQRLKAIHVSPHLHQGHTTIRVFTVNQTAPDPVPFVFLAEEL